jgi:hypothetical protein
VKAMVEPLAVALPSFIGEITDGCGLTWKELAPKSCPLTVHGTRTVKDTIWKVIGKENGLKISIGGIDGQGGELDPAGRRANRTDSFGR